MSTSRTGTIESLAQLQAAVSGPAFDEVRVEAEDQLSRALRHMLAMADERPELRASAEFQALARTVEAVEESLSIARRRYNRTANDYNRRLRGFPGNLIARLLGLQPKPLLGPPFEEENGSLASQSRRPR
jgi:LemA protein